MFMKSTNRAVKKKYSLQGRRSNVLISRRGANKREECQKDTNIAKGTLISLGPLRFVLVILAIVFLPFPPYLHGKF
jgi:hypothetical protein